ncbi:hypothetical protein LA080_003839 [Diaporthe eres]|nr:hypothetical protein LA080_003839 [Diaporthe eres]
MWRSQQARPLPAASPPESQIPSQTLQTPSAGRLIAIDLECPETHKTQPRAIFPLCTLGPGFPSRRASFGDAGAGYGRTAHSNRTERTFEIPISMHSLRRLHARLRGDTLELWLPREGEGDGLARNQATKGRLATAYAFLNQGPILLALARLKSHIVSYSSG